MLTRIAAEVEHARESVSWPAVRLFLVAIVLIAGCSRAPTPPFPLSFEGRDRDKVTPAQREAIEKTLIRIFGTPDDPLVPDGADLRLDLLQMAAGRIQGDSEGNYRGLFRQHCVACHGLAGDGAGVAAAMLDPYPRDFRNGIFKYTSTAGGAKPIRDDLRHTLSQGIPGTAMPSQALLEERQREALIEYVKYLSLRGETELYLFRLVVDGDEPLPLRVSDVVTEGVLPAVKSWNKAPSLVVEVPSPLPMGSRELFSSSANVGKGFYLKKEAQCVRCHGPNGAGDGEEKKDIYDDWNKAKKGVTPDQTRQLASRFSLPIQQLRPRNFKEGIFHGGSRPEDIFLRIYVGIKGTPMPAAGPGPNSEGTLKPDEIWSIVDFVRWQSQQ
jgi:mono/diheme cytochrome c family protein